MKASYKRRSSSIAATVIITIIAVLWLFPVFQVVVNSIKKNAYVNSAPFSLPTKMSFSGLENYVKGLTFGNYPFLKSAFYTVFISFVSTILIVLFCSLAAWYIVRVRTRFSRAFYYLCLFSMITPFQMVMFTLTSTADALGLNTPYTIPIIYLGFGAGLATFVFTGCVEGIPKEIEQASAIDGCSPLRNFFTVVFPMMRPTMVSVGILELMWIWNDYLLPYLILDITEYRTIPIHIQYLQGSYGSVDLGATMAVITMSILPIILVYLFCQKYIIKGIVSGAVKG